jgi:hypothetical protein
MKFSTQKKLQMKHFKIIDFWITISLVLGALVCIPIRPGTAFIIGYFGVGTWHVISMLIHFFNKWFTDKSEARYNYQWTVFMILLLTLAGILIEPILWILAVIMLIAAPIMISIYANICYDEIQKMKRPLEQLK